MKRLITLAVTLVATLGLAAFAGTAVAGNGHGNGNDGATSSGSVSVAPATTPGNSGNAPGQAKKSDQTQQPSSTQSTSHGESGSHQSSTQHSSSTSSSTSQPGTKPSSTTHHWTHTTVGANPDVSKRYGNGSTAAQIAQSRGAPGSTPLTGPGNSQPHKVTVCGKPSNRSGGVDVHAVKSYDTSSCTQQTQSQQTQQTQQTQTTGQCPAGTQTRSETETATNGVWHKTGNGFVLIHPSANSAHDDASKHSDDVVDVTTVTRTIDVATGETCSTTTTTSSQPSLLPSVASQTTTGAVAAAGVSANTAAPAVQGVQAASPTGAGGVLGAQATLGSPHHAAGGVLGTVSHVAGTTLPFTGLPLWIAVLIAAALIAGGAIFRRHGRSQAEL